MKEEKWNIKISGNQDDLNTIKDLIETLKISNRLKIGLIYQEEYYEVN